MALSPAARRSLALATGLLLFLAFPNPWALAFQAWTGWVAWLALVPLLAALDGAPADEAWRLGGLAGLAAAVPSLQWMLQIRPMGWGVWPAWAALALFCAAYVALFGAVAGLGLRRGWPQPVLWLPAAWTLTEWLRERFLSGFPWNSLGSSQYANAALRPLAALCGSAGLHYAVALGNAIAFSLLVKPRWLLGWARCAGAVGVALALAAGARWQGAAQAAFSAAHPADLKVAVVQGGIDLDQPWTRAFRARELGAYLDASAQAADQGAQLLLWPESAFPGFFDEDAPEAEAVKSFARRRRVSLLVGATLSQGGYRNAAVWVDPDGDTQSYAKRHLVPFGEYVPFAGLVPGLQHGLEDMGVACFRPGDAPGRFQAGSLAVSPLICYESIFPDLARQGSPPDLLAILTVDTWYGDTACPVYHASQACLRAVENGCWTGRAAATGISLFAGPDGGLRAWMPLERAGWILQSVGPGRPTPYQRWGDWWVALCALGLAAAALATRWWHQDD